MMADNRKKLLDKTIDWHTNFGEAIKSITINGFRGISNLTIYIEYPITAISGANGSGKSTIGQLAVCAYNLPRDAEKKKKWYVSNFFPYSKIDNPFTEKASVQFQYAINKDKPKTLTISRTKSTKYGWSGYYRRPEKQYFYIGFALFIPKVERPDFSVRNPESIQIEEEKRHFSDNVRKYVANILNCIYDDILFQTITDSTGGGAQKEIGLATRNGYSYSENNMGFGEGRLMYMIDLLENTPDKSFFVIEEPETSLHEDAQYKLILYLMDVCNRKGHQIVLSTHSGIILEALPPEGRKFIIRDKSGVKILDRVSAGRAKSLLTDGREKALIICVEDNFAKLLLEEAIRKFGDQKLLQSINIVAMGDRDAVRKSIEFLLKIKQNAIAIRDADIGENKTKKLYKLPGTSAPEKEVYENADVQKIINDRYSIDTKTIFSQQDLNHHDYGKILSQKASCSEEAMNMEAIRAYLDIVGNDIFKNLIQTIKNEMETYKITKYETT
jgi:predicted ATPase